MSFQITTHFVDQFKATLWHLVQQKGSRLRDRVTIDNVTGEAAYFDQLGPTEAIERTARHADSPLVHTPHDRRKIFLRDFEWGDLIDDQDKIRMIVDPTSAYMRNAMWALGRTLDRLIIAGATANALTGRNGGTVVPFPVPEQRIPADGTGLTIDKLLKAKEKLDAAEVPDEVPRTLVCSAKQITNLLGTTQVTSADYNTVKALVNGEVNDFLKFTFVRTEQLGLVGNERRCLAFAKTGIGLAIGKDMKGRIAERPDKSFATYVYAAMTADAVRLEEKQVVDILCVEE